MELKYIYLGGFHKHFTSDRTYSVWKFSAKTWRIRDDLNQLVNMSDSAFNKYFITIEDYRNRKLESIGI